ncbi:MAG: hypothetical protein R8G66_16680 [Cytophagales bacterium]|nr:hypothetical protein [Cytophagales bacterium]MDW3194012.1 hypothetical protein [Cytophagales bacterium]
MKLDLKHKFVGLLSLLFLLGCEETVELPAEPAISFKSFEFLESNKKLEAVRLTFDLQDGDGDMGLKPEQNFVPFHEFDLILDADNQLVKQSNEVNAPFYRLQPNGERFFFSEGKERPIYNAFDYMLMDSASDGTVLSDTVLIHRNPFHYNLYLSILKKGKYGFASVGLNPVGRGRLPIYGRFDVELPPKKQGPLISEVSFDVGKRHFAQLNPTDTLKLQFYIFDRKLNQSNLEVTPEFILGDLISAN